MPDLAEECQKKADEEQAQPCKDRNNRSQCVRWSVEYQRELGLKQKNENNCPKAPSE